jgi:hypothetical protein
MIPSARDGRVGPTDRRFYSRLDSVETLVDYERRILFLARERELEDEAADTWLFAWREGGPSSAAAHVGPELSGVPQWIATPLSETRLAQVLEEHISLREALLLSEAPLYLLLGNDPLNPDSVTPLEPYQLPGRLLPSGDVSVYNNSLPFLSFLSNESAPARFLMHLVPGRKLARSPTWLVSGAIQESIQRYLSRATRSLLASSEGTAVDYSDPVDLADWAGMSTVRSTPGTLTVEAQSGDMTTAQRGSFGMALIALGELTRGSIEAEGIARLSSRLGLGGLSSIHGLLDLLASHDIGLALKWQVGEEGGYAAVGRASAERTTGVLNEYLLSRAEVTAQNEGIIVVKLDAHDAESIRKWVDPQAGGHQALISTLQSRLSESGELRLTPDLVERVVRYVQDYGPGGFQNRLRPVYRAIYRFGISFVALR